MSTFTLKLFACFFMVVDHIKYALPVTLNFFTEYFGRLSFPIFAFLISEGYLHTHDKKRYLLRLFLFAIISQIPFYFFIRIYLENITPISHLNIYFTLCLGLIAILLIDKLPSLLEKRLYMPRYGAYTLSVLGILFLYMIANILHVDYNGFGILCILSFYIFKKHKIINSLSFILLTFIYYFERLTIYFSQKNLCFFLFTCMTLVPILLYNGKKGKSAKRFFYWFYPIHLCILVFLNAILV